MGYYNLNTTEEEWFASRPAWERRQIRLHAAQRMGRHTDAEWCEKRDRVGRCAACGASSVRLSKDHIIPISRGGCDCIDNLQPLCDSCNSSKGAR